MRSSPSPPCATYQRATFRGPPRAAGKDAPNLSPSLIARLRDEWQASMTAGSGASCQRGTTSTSGRMASTLQARMEPQAECMLVLIGATPEGKKELLGVQVGIRAGASC